MLLNTANDPVNIKKIRLKVWSIRSEIEAQIRQKKIQNQEINIDELTKEYDYEPLDINDGDSDTLELTPDDLDDSEDAMAAAMGESDNSEEDTQDVEESDNLANENEPENTLTDNSKIIIRQTKPPIPEDEIYSGSMLLAEINMDSVLLFVNKKFLEGQSIAIEFLVPKKFILRAKVKYCRTYSIKSRIIGENKLPYRLQAVFTLGQEGERTILRSFIKSILPDMTITSDQAKTTDEDDDDDFSELDNL